MFLDIVAGAFNTLLIAITSWAVGLPLGIALSFLMLLNPERRVFVREGAVFLSVVPFLAILFWVHYPLQVLLGVVWPPLFTSIALLSVFVAFMVGDIIASEMISIKQSLFETAQVLGISNRLFIGKVVFPASMRGSLPRRRCPAFS